LLKSSICEPFIRLVLIFDTEDFVEYREAVGFGFEKLDGHEPLQKCSAEA
jgi:hypothetical protein